MLLFQECISKKIMQKNRIIGLLIIAILILGSASPVSAALTESDLGMYTTLGSDSWIQPAFSDQLDYHAVTSCSVYEYSSYIGVSTLTMNPNDFIDPYYREWNIGTGYETYHVAFIRPNQMKISVIGPGGGNILGTVCTVPGSTAVTASPVVPKVISIIDNQTATTKG